LQRTVPDEAQALSPIHNEVHALKDAKGFPNLETDVRVGTSQVRDLGRPDLSGRVSGHIAKVHSRAWEVIVRKISLNHFNGSSFVREDSSEVEKQSLNRGDWFYISGKQKKKCEKNYEDCSQALGEALESGAKAERLSDLKCSHEAFEVSKSSKREDVDVGRGVSHLRGRGVVNFPLVASDKAYWDCGKIFAVGCLNVEAHQGMNLDGVDMTGKAVVKYVRNSCHRALCPICWVDWANREAKKAVRRLDAFVLKNHGGKRLRPIHVVVSLPRFDYFLPFDKMREKSYGVLKHVNLLGGMMIYHPRRKKKSGEWYYSPHFHVVGYGWIRDVRHVYVYSGYVVRNLGVRRSVKATVFYQLSHCGISEDYHTVTWFGCLSYNKLRVPKIEDEPSVCPLCGQRLRKLLWIGKDENFVGWMHEEVESGFYFEDPTCYMYKPSRRFGIEFT
jgi:hypothetical protein